MKHKRKTPAPTAPTSLQDLTSLIQAAEGFRPLISALQGGRSGAIDGAWGSAGALAAAALGQFVPRTLLIVIAHPRAVDSWADDLHSFSGTRPTRFPAWDNLPADNVVVDEIASQRLRVLQQFDRAQPPRCLLATFQALMQPVPDRARMAVNRRALKPGTVVEPDSLALWLVEHGFHRVEAVELPGEFSRRGGIMDVYSPDADAPYRLEFFGDEIESIRQFSAQTQRSLGQMEAIELLGSSKPVDGELWATGHLVDYLPEDAWVVLVEPGDLDEQGKHYLERADGQTGLFSVAGTLAQLCRLSSVTVSALPSATVETACHLRVESVERFSGNIAKLREELSAAAAGERVLIACHNEAEAQRLTEILGPNTGGDHPPSPP